MGTTYGSTGLSSLVVSYSSIVTKDFDYTINSNTSTFQRTGLKEHSISSREGYDPGTIRILYWYSVLLLDYRLDSKVKEATYLRHGDVTLQSQSRRQETSKTGFWARLISKIRVGRLYSNRGIERNEGTSCKIKIRVTSGTTFEIDIVFVLLSSELHGNLVVSNQYITHIK